MFKFCSMFYSSGKLIFSLVTLYKNVTLVKNCIVLSLQVCAVEICARIMMSEAGCFFFSVFVICSASCVLSFDTQA